MNLRVPGNAENFLNRCGTLASQEVTCSMELVGLGGWLVSCSDSQSVIQLVGWLFGWLFCWLGVCLVSYIFIHLVG